MDTHLESTPEKPVPISSFWVLGARVTWIMIGPVLLVGIAYAMVTGGTGWLTILDLAFVAVAGLMLLGRWTEQRSGSATTLTGAPATPEQLKRYATILIPFAATVWVVANYVGNHVLK